ncbi:hypothetical protein [Phytoactinopolyspora limicola]|uniref:hypothetical protein n=1 Tax=Phytoactinopolyspora limicola TaxID=2715536 RepID=UPI001408A315|nr:hypothetical protein [Phytoactinopolyspora limicola]
MGPVIAIVALVTLMTYLVVLLLDDGRRSREPQRRAEDSWSPDLPTEPYRDRIRH